MRNGNASPRRRSSSTLLQQYQPEDPVYFDRRFDRHVPPPFLRVRGSTPTRNEGAGTEEVDPVAPQSVLQRVSSFGFIARVSSTGAFATPPEHDMQDSKNSSDRSSPRKSNARRRSVGSSPLRPLTPATTKRPSKENKKKTDPSNLGIIPSWRVHDRTKTVGVGLILSLNIGGDRPGALKPHPSATLQCWMEPPKGTGTDKSRTEAKRKIAERLQAQYAKWKSKRAQNPLLFRHALDPTIESVQDMCLNLRRAAKQERVILHYNGHGAPSPTAKGEIFFWDKHQQRFKGHSVSHIRGWIGTPSAVVLDCNSAASLIPAFTTPPVRTASDKDWVGTGSTDMETAANFWMKNVIVFCPTSPGETLPMHPEYPADIFTCCLTTPIQIALRWFIRQNRHSMGSLDPDAVDVIPGKEDPHDRMKPLGELNWIFTTIADSIAWNVLPKALFKRLLRQDSLLSSLFRNFLLADRIMRSLNCTPESSPPIPAGTAGHPLWHAWDLACETCLFRLIQNGTFDSYLATPTSNDEIVIKGKARIPKNPRQMIPSAPLASFSSPFFTEQLKSLKIWVEQASLYKQQTQELEPPVQLPVMLQALLSQIYRRQALELLRQFLELGPWAINLALSLGIFFYIMKLLQSPEYKTVQFHIWASILKFDPTCREDLVKDSVLYRFIEPLAVTSPDFFLNADAIRQQTLAAFILSATCHKFPQAQEECSKIERSKIKLFTRCSTLLTQMGEYLEQQKKNGEDFEDKQQGADSLQHQLLVARMWLCLCFGNLVQSFPPLQYDVHMTNAHQCLLDRASDVDSHVRAAAMYALGCLLEHNPTFEPKIPSMAFGKNPVQNALYFHPTTGLSPGSRFARQGNQPPPVFVPSHTSARTLTVPASGLTDTMVLSAHLTPNATTPLPPGMVSSQFRPPISQPMGDRDVSLMTQPQVGQPIAAGHGMLGAPTVVGPLAGGPMPNSGLPIGMHSLLRDPHKQFSLPPGITMPLAQSSSPNFLVQQSQSPLGATGFPTSRLSNMPVSQPRLSVYEDRQRVGLDLDVMTQVLHGFKDGSAVVRYEAVMACSCFVAKYVQVFLFIDEERNQNSNSDCGLTIDEALDLPFGLSRPFFDRFAECYSAVSDVVLNDPHPKVSQGADNIIAVIRNRLHDQKSTKLSGIREEVSRTEEEDNAMRNFQERVSPPHELLTAKPLTADNAISAGANDSDDETQTTAELQFPTSEFFEWKQSTFEPRLEASSYKAMDDRDPLNPESAAHTRQLRCIARAREEGQNLSRKFHDLVPGSTELRQDWQRDEVDTDYVTLKRDLKMEECHILNNEGSNNSSILRFHPYDDMLMVCHDNDGITIWDYENRIPKASFANGNTAGTRMTSAFWMNETSNSCFFVGSDDGSARVWSGLGDNNGDDLSTSPVLLSAFHAVPDMESGLRGRSGLIAEWQQFSGSLIAGGNSEHIRWWDMQAEKCSREIKTTTEGYMTALTTAWDTSVSGSRGFSGIGPDVVVAGLSDGSMKVFDIREGAHEQGRWSFHAEHGNWIVDVSFTNHGTNFEIISGSIGGELRAWDLRMPSSLRSLDLQRRPMTAMSIHKHVPIAATGFKNQTIKLVTLEGDTLQGFRHHNNRQKLGPICCLEFHREKMLLAAGAANSRISIYKPITGNDSHFA